MALESRQPVDLALSCQALSLFDLALTDQHDLQIDNSLNTAIVISLFTDRYDPATGQGGYWGDQHSNHQIHMGSRLWLLKGSKVTQATLRSAEDYANESLKWLIDDELALSVTTSARWEYHGTAHQLILEIVVATNPNSRFTDQHYQQSFIVAR